MGNSKPRMITVNRMIATPKLPTRSLRLRRSHKSGFSNHYINRYSHFQVDSERSHYLLHVSGGSGNLNPSYFTSYQNKVEFSTWDKDRDGTSSSYNCAKDYLFTGWWINGAGNSCTGYQAAGFNLNGPYDKYRIRGWYQRINTYSKYHPTFVEMKVRRL